MTDSIYVTITRGGAHVSGSPFIVKLRYRRLHVDPQIAPIAAKRPIQEFLIFQNILAAVEVGDIVTLPGGALTRIIDVRNYANSLQCILQRLPYVSMSLWVPVTASSAMSGGSLPDVNYVASSAVLASIEPHGLDQPGSLPVGVADRRSAWIFSLTSLSVQSVVLNYPDYWLVIATSSMWPITNDFRAPARRLLLPPLGI